MSASAIVLLHDSVRMDTAVPEELLRQLFGLSFAEARLARGLAEGWDLRETGESLGLNYQTARSYLKSVFLKTGVRKQSDLVRLISLVAQS